MVLTRRETFRILLNIFKKTQSGVYRRKYVVSSSGNPGCQDDQKQIKYLYEGMILIFGVACNLSSESFLEILLSIRFVEIIVVRSVNDSRLSTKH